MPNISEVGLNMAETKTNPGKMNTQLIAIVVVVIVIIGAYFLFSGGGNKPAYSTTAPTTAQATTTTPGATSSAPTTSVAPSVDRFSISETEYTVTPNAIGTTGNVKAGDTVIFMVRNTGSIAHNLYVGGLFSQPLIANTPLINPGSNYTLTFTAPSTGNWTYYSNRTGERILVSGVAGIQGTLVVSAVPGGTSTTTSTTATSTSTTIQRVDKFTVYEKEYSYSPNVLPVHSGDLVIINSIDNGTISHTLVVQGLSGASTPVINPGQNYSISFTAPPAGNYTFYCSVDGHRQLGMVGTLVVR